MLNRVIGLVGGAVLLAGCSVYGNLEDLQSAERQGTPFTQALADEYQEFAEYEMFEMHDHVDGDYFARKGLRAAGGEVVMPEDLASWNLPEDRISVLDGARNRLIRALDANGRSSHPEAAAEAQAKFDCWVEQQEENHQPEHIAVCQREFIAAMNKLEDLMAPEPEPAPAPEPVMEPASFLVFFEFDDATVNSGAATVLDLVAAKYEEFGMADIEIVGHTDTSGSADYNEALSQRRANNVYQYLIQAGIPAGAMDVDARGESEPLEATADGVRNPQNRRAAITISPAN
jgi:OOP family OmpA-OmpF porin